MVHYISELCCPPRSPAGGGSSCPADDAVLDEIDLLAEQGFRRRTKSIVTLVAGSGCGYTVLHLTHLPPPPPIGREDTKLYISDLHGMLGVSPGPTHT